MKLDYAADTPVRLHDGVMTRDICFADAVVPSEWREYRGSIGGVAADGPVKGRFWPGAVSFRLFFAANYGEPDSVTYIDDVSVTSE